MNQNSAMVLNLVIMFFMGMLVWLFFLRNFLLSWLKTKMPVTKYNVMVEVEHAVMNYFAPGQIEKSFLYYKGKKTKDNPKGDRIIDLTNIEKEVGIGAIVHRAWGVQNIRVDDSKGCCLYRDEVSYKSVSGYSPEAISDLVYDAQNRPSLEDGMLTPKLFQIIVIALLCVTVVAQVMTYIQDGKNTELLDGHQKMTYDYVVATAKNLNVTSNPNQNFTGIGG